MKGIALISMAMVLTSEPGSALIFTYTGYVTTVEAGRQWSVTGLDVGAPFEARLQIDEQMLGQDLNLVYLLTGIHPATLEFLVAETSIQLSPFFVSHASVNSGSDFQIGGEGSGPGAFWGMWGTGSPEQTFFGASALLYGGPTFTAEGVLNVPDAGPSLVLLTPSFIALSLLFIMDKTIRRKP